MPSNSKNIAELLNTDTTIAVTDVADGSITEDKLSNTLNLSSKTVTLPIGVGGLNWTNSIKTSNFTAVEGNGYYVDTSSTAVTVTLPSSPSAGHQVSVIDYAKNSANNNIIINPNGNKIIGVSVNTTISENGISLTLVYSGSTKGWLQVSTSDETSTKSQSASLSVNYLLVAGGGGGGSSGSGSGGGGGGGAGGLLSGTATINAFSSHPITVGQGAAGGSAGSSQQGGTGGNSTFNSLTALGGGGGGRSQGNGASGGSGGGRGYAGYSNNSGYGNGTSGQGNRGGAVSSVSASGAGGGGAGGVGGTNSGSGGGIPGVGGDGVANSITGTSVTYARGGAGGNFTNSLHHPNDAGGSANDGLGNGGGGAYSTGAPNSGSDGVVIISYISTSPIFSGGTITNYTSGSDTYQVHKFTSNGTLVGT